MLFDSRLDQLKLPIVRPPPRNFLLVEEEEPSVQVIPVSAMVQKYFDWIADVEVTGK